MQHDEVFLQWTNKKKPTWDTNHCQNLQTVFPNANNTAPLINEPTDDVKNQMLLGNDHQVMAWLLANGFQQSFDCIYIDPPYLSDTQYYAQVKIETENGTQQVKQPVFHDSGYRHRSAYLQNLYQTIAMAKELLSAQGSLFVHLDWHSSHYIKIIMDEVFGARRFINEIVWCYGGGSGARRHFHRKHDVILWYSRGEDYIFNPQHRPYSPGTLQRGLTKVKGDRYKLDSRGALLQDWWVDIPKILSPTAENNWKFPTQKPVELLERIIKTSTLENSLVGDFYAGSGTTAEACENLGRRWVISDNQVYSIQTSLHRLVRNNSRPFIIGNLQSPPGAKGQLSVETRIEPQLWGCDLTVVLQSYQPNDIRQSSLSWIDFWELGWVKDGAFFSTVQVLPRKRGQSIPVSLTVRIDEGQWEDLMVQAWDIQGGPVMVPVKSVNT
ncbi:MAG: DNA methyltransferase [Syntrophomonadaceae bacterium]|nr:site-specific DNA-methyltransferase [Bacillota bacterium]NLM88466.1 site-specific DNA-methyltransferase [Syntrophomonadaceae bacterium]HAA08652.1 hypothetical protein [Syntrophomonas sp.]HQA49097.1 site-specific DNA-methyltransferase [Syntrophomonadaceae bacterium]HQD89469.1 site-specific DNA-methyltransferase [Syntrophomonadaceae bacterium]